MVEKNGSSINRIKEIFSGDFEEAHEKRLNHGNGKELELN